MAYSKVITQNDVQNILAHINLGDDAHTEITQAEFNALTDEEKNDGTIYFITDGIMGNVFLDDNTPIGTIAPYGGTSDPSYWLICDGRAISRTTYAELFAVIGTTYGSGDGSTTFNIPDLRGNVAVGSNETYILGTSGGEATHTLTTDEMPSHSHELGIAVNGVDADYRMGYNATNATTDGSSYPNYGRWRNATDYSQYYGVALTTGGSQAHNIMQPYIVTNYIIKYASTVSRHQANIDFFYPVGSYYETSNADFDPNITWGGTWVLENEGQVHVSAGTNYEIGDTGGEAEHTLTVNEMPSHTHTMLYAGGSASTWGYSYTSSGGTRSGQTEASGGVGPTGSGQPHNNMQPYIVVNRWHRTA